MLGLLNSPLILEFKVVTMFLVLSISAYTNSIYFKLDGSSSPVISAQILFPKPLTTRALKLH